MKLRIKNLVNLIRRRKANSSTERQAQKEQALSSPSPEVVTQWDVARRTAEFFDGTLGNLRTVGLTASVTLIGLAYQFHVSPLLFAAGLLNVALLTVDMRYQGYLKATAKYANMIEETYDFCSKGLTHAINDARNKYRKHLWGKLSSPDTFFVVVYILLSVVSFGLFIHWN
jgi:hypothetical protein